MRRSTKRKSARQLVAVGRQNIRHARRHVGIAWRLQQEMRTVLTRLARTRPHKPISTS